MNEFPAWLASTLASDATEGRNVLPPWIGPLKPNSRVVGPAFVALMSQDDNLSVREAMIAAHSPGTVLVVAGGSTSRTATIGGLIALEMQNMGIVALVTDGLVRDARDLPNATIQRVVPRRHASSITQTRSGGGWRLGLYRRDPHPGWRPGHRRR